MASTDANKLVAVSLSKIAASRATRTGINLYKSLMVSSVLYKARTIVIMEKYNGPFTGYEKSSESSVDNVDDQDCDETKDIQTTDIDDYDFDDNEDDASSENQTDCTQELTEDNTTKVNELEDKENVSSNQDIQTSTGKIDNVTSTTTTSSCQVLKSCENTTQNLDNNEIIKCERCTKRRFSDVESSLDNVSASKKMKNEEDTVVENCENNSKEQPMDGVQITQLVDSFTSGFTGLISQGCSSTNNNKSSSVLQQVNDQNCRNSSTTSSKSHGLSEAFNHCSTQIKESFETLASPIMALGITA